MQILSGKLTAKQEFVSEVTVLGRALTKTYKNTRMQKVSKLKKLGKNVISNTNSRSRGH